MLHMPWPTDRAHEDVGMAPRPLIPLLGFPRYCPHALSSGFADFEGVRRGKKLSASLLVLGKLSGSHTGQAPRAKEADSCNLPPHSSRCYSFSPRSSPRPPSRPSSRSSPAGSSLSVASSSPKSSSPAATSATDTGRGSTASSAMPPGTSTPSHSDSPSSSSRSSRRAPHSSGPSMTHSVDDEG